MKIEQKKLSNTHTFTFGDRTFNFAYKDRSGSGDADFSYAALPLKSGIRNEENTWWRNIGYIWCALGGFYVISGLLSGERFSGFWLLAGLVCLGIYRYTKLSYTVFNVHGGGVYIIQDGKTHDSIVAELQKRRKAQLLQLYGEVDMESSLEQEKAKFEYLLEQEVLSADEAAAKILQAQTVFEAKPGEAPLLLN